jgi:uncharacterized membrane protein YcaP (DUF421 family)
MHPGEAISQSGDLGSCGEGAVVDRFLEFDQSFGQLIARKLVFIIIGGMWHLSLPWWEFVLRGIIIYIFLIVILRATGKRQIGQMSPFDLVLLLVLSNGVQNSMNGGDNTVTGGMILSITLVSANWIAGKITFSSKKAERLIEGAPQVLVHNGRVYEAALSDAQLTRHELMSAIRTEGYTDLNEIRAVMLENDGSISVIAKRSPTS